MITNFTENQLADPHIAEANQILKACQHFGFCTSGCPTYVLLHDENDGPRGRIDLIKQMLETGGRPDPKAVEHIDRCLSCMSCMTTCAVKVDYMHLVDTARAQIEETYQRPLGQRLVRNLLANVLTRPPLFRIAMQLGRMAKPFAALVPRGLRPMLQLVPHPPSRDSQDVVNRNRYPAHGERKWRVALLAGCVQPEMAPQINAATIRMLTRYGCEVVIPPELGCCGSLPLHIGKKKAASEFARANVEKWFELISEGLDAIVVNASGCGTTIKDYGHLLKDDPKFATKAKIVSAKAKDITEWLTEMKIPAPKKPVRHRVTYHDACSMRNSQKVTNQPRALLNKAGFRVSDVPEAHFCCGSAGTYNLLQPTIASDLGKRKAKNIESTTPQIVSAGNIGCITQIGMYVNTPILHTIELLDWAHGGPRPLALRGLNLEEIATESETESSSFDSQVIQICKNKPPASGDVGVW